MKGWRPGDQLVSGGRRRRIPEDVVAIILSYLPLKSLGRFKAVSTSWSLLIQSLNISRIFLGLFVDFVSRSPTLKYYQQHPIKRSSPFALEEPSEYFVGIGSNSSSTIDPALSFLRISYMRILDCCNGLLLVRRRQSPYNFYICNPLTKSCSQLHNLDLDDHFYLLDFDPKVSPNFKLVSFPAVVHRNASVLRISLLSSETMTRKSYQPIKFRDPSVDEHYQLMGRNHHHALWEGSLYLLFGRDSSNFGDAGRIMRFDMLEGHVDPQFIELPQGTKKPRDIVMGRLRNKLCLAGLDNITNNNASNKARLRVWSLSKRDQTVWVLEHDNVVTSSHLPWASACIGQFHPFLDVVFILSENVVYAYNLENFSVNEVCPIASDQWKVRASIYPFLPSLVDYSIQ